MKQYEEKIIPDVDVGDLVAARLNGCNAPAVEGVVTENGASLCIIDTCDSILEYESVNGLPARPKKVPMCAYIFGDNVTMDPAGRMTGVTVTKL